MGLLSENKQNRGLLSRSVPQEQEDQEESLGKQFLRGTGNLGVGLLKTGFRTVKDPIKTSKKFAEGFVDSTPGTVSAVQRFLGTSLRVADKVAPGEFLTSLSGKFDELADANSETSRILQQQGVDINDHRTFSQKLRDPNFIVKDLLGANILPLASVLGVGAAASIAGGPAAGIGAGLGVGLSIEGGAAHNEAKQFLENSDDPELVELSKDKAYLDKIGIAVGSINSVLETIPVGKILTKSPAGKVAKKKILNRALQRVTSIGKQGALEGGTESLQEIVGNAVATVYNEDQELFEGVPESAVAGLLLGAGADVIGTTGKGLLRSAVEAEKAVPGGRQGGFIRIPGGKDPQQDFSEGDQVETHSESVLLEKAKNFKDENDFISTVTSTHRPPDAEDGAKLSNLTELYPDDVYSPDGPRLYSSGFKELDKQAFDLARNLRDKPDAEVTIYRAVAKDESPTINPGDWVSVTKGYVEQHELSNLPDGGKIVSKKVKAKDIVTAADSIQEWGYRPDNHRDFNKAELSKIWQKATKKKTIEKIIPKKQIIKPTESRSEVIKKANEIKAKKKAKLDREVISERLKSINNRVRVEPTKKKKTVKDIAGVKEKDVTEFVKQDTKVKKKAVDVFKNIGGLEKTKQNIEQAKIELEIAQESLSERPARKLSKFVSAKTGTLPEVTGVGKGKFAKSGDDIVTELGYKDTEEAKLDFESYQKDSIRVKERRQAVKEKVADYRDRKAILDELKKIVKATARRRRERVNAVKDFFTFTDGEMKKVMNKSKATNLELMSTEAFDKFMIRLQEQAVNNFELLELRTELKTHIFEKEFKKVANLQKAMKLPENINDMTEEQVQLLNETLADFEKGDVFLGARQLETVDKTDLSGIKTIREAREKLAKETGASMSELAGLEISEFDRFRYDSALARQNPLYKVMVESVSKEMYKQEAEMLIIKDEVNRLIKMARKSRKRSLFEKIIPTDEMIFNWLEADTHTKDLMVPDMTPQELEAGMYIRDRYEDARDYLLKNQVLNKYRQNYVTHTQRSFLEGWKKDSLLTAFKEISNKFQNNLAVFRILNEKTGSVLPLEKFFQFSMQRSDNLVPSKNVAKSVNQYFATFHKKKALDSIVPKLAIYAHALSPQLMTQRGLDFDPRIKEFVYKWLNSKKGRVDRLVFEPGGKLDTSLRSVIALTRLLDLGFSIPVGIASIGGETTANYVSLGTKQFAVGIKRRASKKGGDIIKKYKNFVGESLFEKIDEQSNDIVDKLMSTAFGFFNESARLANQQYLLGSLTKQEFESGVVSDQRLAEIKNAMGRWRVVEGATSIAGKSGWGKAFTQYKTWAVPIASTTTSNIQALIKMAQSKDKNFYKTQEFQETLRSVAMSATLMAMITLYLGGLEDKRDKTFFEEIVFKGSRDVLSIVGALKPSFFVTPSRVVGFGKDLGLALDQVAGYLLLDADKGSKGYEKLKKVFTPSVARHLLPSKSKKLSQATRDAYRDILAGGKESFVHNMEVLSDTRPDVYKKVLDMLKDDAKGITDEDRLIRSMGVSNGERSREIYRQMSDLKSEDEQKAFINSLIQKKILTKDVLVQLVDLVENNGKPAFEDDTSTSDVDLIGTIALYAKAIGTDPLTVFDRTFRNQKIRRIDNGTIIIERNTPILGKTREKGSGIAGLTRDFSGDIRARLGATTEQRLDHTIPIQLGGSDSEVNLKLISKDLHASYNPVENYLGRLLRKEKITKKEAQETITDFKQGLLSEAEVYNKFEE